MIKFRQKIFSEYDAMRSLYVELMKDPMGKTKYGVIDTNALIPILRGNNVVIERFVISTSFAHRDKYRMYLKIGAKAKMPDEVRLPQTVDTRKLGNASLSFNTGIFNKTPNNEGGNQKQKQHSENSSITPIFRQKEFKGGPPPDLSAKFEPYVNLNYEVKRLLGEAIKYDKKERSLVLEFDSIQDAIRALNILPFGLGYKIYLLN